MKVVLDANFIINKELPTGEITEAYITTSVQNEIKDRQSQDYLSLYNFMIVVRDPKQEYVEIVKDKIKGLLLYLSSADVDVVALTLELSEEINEIWIDSNNISNLEKICCLSKDNGVRSALRTFNLETDSNFQEKKFKLRCFACSTLYSEHVDFCKNCGYNTITRVSVVDENGQEKVLLRKNYVVKNKQLKTRNGINLISADQKEYLQYLNEMKRNEKKNNKINFFE